jgi:hypothetical protein
VPPCSDLGTAITTSVHPLRTYVPRSTLVSRTRYSAKQSDHSIDREARIMAKVDGTAGDEIGSDT